METGYGKDKDGNRHPHALNFDVLAHETGHGLVFSMVGLPHESRVTTEYRGFHESSSDLVALLTVLHFSSFLGRLLKNTSGNLYRENMLNRIGELSRSEEIRMASNSFRMRDCIDRRTPVKDVTYKQVHKLGEPLTGAFFDILVELYQKHLVASGAISREMDHASSRMSSEDLANEALQQRYEEAYSAHPGLFRDALEKARDEMGLRLAETWRRLGPDYLTFGAVARTFLTVDRRLSGNRYQAAIIDSFRWREIGFGYPAAKGQA